MLYFLLKLVEILSVVSLDFVELATIVGLRPYDVFLQSWRLWNVIHVEDLSPYLLPASVWRCEALGGFSALFQRRHVSNGRHVLTPSWDVIIECAFIFISILLFSIIFLALYVTFCSCHYFGQGPCLSLDEGFIEVSRPVPILKYPYEHFPILLDYLDCPLIEAGDIFPYRFRRTLKNVE